MARRRDVPAIVTLVDDVLSSLFPSSSEVDRRGRACWRPAVDVYRTPDGVVVACDLPGVPREAIELTMAGRMLTVSGERPGPDDVDVVESWQSPRGPFSVTVRLPVGVDRDGADARLKDGRLVVLLPYEGGPVIEGTYRVVVEP